MDNEDYDTLKWFRYKIERYDRMGVHVRRLILQYRLLKDAYEITYGEPMVDEFGTMKAMKRHKL